MLTVRTFLERTFPSGTIPATGSAVAGLDAVPTWPPDLFAAAAGLVERAGCYSHPSYAGGGWSRRFHEDGYIKRVQSVAEAWSGLSIVDPPGATIAASSAGGDGPESPVAELVRRWQALAACTAGIEPCDAGNPPPSWCDDAMWLLAVADEASAGIGFFRSPTDSAKVRPFVDYWITHYTIWDLWLSLKKQKAANGPTSPEVIRPILSGIFGEATEPEFAPLLDDAPKLLAWLRGKMELPYLTSSLCKMVPRAEACVQPKTRTSGVGCTLRSLSHHLALLPPASQVETRWRVANRYPTGRDDAAPGLAQRGSDPTHSALNLLLVPFPFTITGKCFRAGPPCLGSDPVFHDEEGVNRASFFSLQQDWLRRADDPATPITAAEFAAFLIGLVEQAKREVDRVHGIILPELALSSSLADEVAEVLRRETRLELFISGVLTEARAGRGPKNSVYTCIMQADQEEAPGEGHPARALSTRSWEQSKHHRWKVDRHQVRRYHLGGRLDPHVDWWEHIDISPRQCYFGVFRHEACLTALVCEDLARIDPVQTAIRSIGPNLVVALLMDGPQTESRWSGRYATVLADDPGCAVLTLTSLGLLRRSAPPGSGPLCQIALWKEAGGERATELSIAADQHALLLTLSYRRENGFTIDGRPDRTRTVSLSRSGFFAIKSPVPPWLAAKPAPDPVG